MENIFALTTQELKEIANCLQTRIDEGLKEKEKEILAVPTYITPKKEIPDGKVLALDWGGTNFRAAVVEFKNGKPTINKAIITKLKNENGKIEIDKIEEADNKPYLEMATLRLSAIETKGFTQEKLFEAMANTICFIKKLDKSVTNIGYCFSYPAFSLLNGDATLSHWAKGIDIKDMVKQSVGEPLMKYLNTHKDINAEFTNIKVINDTVACLFAGLSEKGYDTYIGLIVGTGTNMASLMRKDKIEKLNDKDEFLIPVNLESGNFNPPYLTIVDGLIDAMTNNKGEHQFEKAISGGYLGEIFKTIFLHNKIKYNFDGSDLSNIIDKNTDNYSAEQVQAAHWIVERSAKLVAASIAGLAQVLVTHDPSVKKIGLAADGSVFWLTPNYKQMVEEELKILLPNGINVETLPEMTDPNLIGSAIAALS